MAGIKQTFIAVGVMSGTSVDGLDLALCRFDRNVTGSDGSEWSFKVLKTSTVSYSGTGWPEMLSSAETADGYRLMEIHRDFGRFTGEAVNKFLAGSGIATPISPGSDPAGSRPTLIASHGHTIFHRPDRGITLQIGCGAEIAAATGITTVSDFRRFDVALGGQGAPLVPVGDELLFGQYDYCLNLGGFANISFRESDKRVAWDICPVNIVLNKLARNAGMEFDNGGIMARGGKVSDPLLKELEELDFYHVAGPRSLGREWVDEIFMPVVNKYSLPLPDKMRTICEHIAMRVAATVRSRSEKAGNTLLSTGGGARNIFLMELISEKCLPVQVIVPDEGIVDFKEAIVFAFLGVLRVLNEPNCLASVTGASRDNCGGIVHRGGL